MERGAGDKAKKILLSWSFFITLGTRRHEKDNGSIVPYEIIYNIPYTLRNTLS